MNLDKKYQEIGSRVIEYCPGELVKGAKTMGDGCEISGWGILATCAECWLKYLPDNDITDIDRQAAEKDGLKAATLGQKEN